MIHFNPTTQTFNLLLATSVYVFQVDAEGRLVHLTWGPRPAGAADTDLIEAATATTCRTQLASFERQTRRDELLTFGDVTYHEVSLKASFASLPGAPAAHEALHLPLRDVRLRYAGHEIVVGAQPGLAPAHGLPTSDSSPRDAARACSRDPVQPFVVTLCYRLTPEYDVLERWCELENTGQETISIEVLSFGVLHLPRGTTELTSVFGGWAREFTVQRERLPVGSCAGGAARPADRACRQPVLSGQSARPGLGGEWPRLLRCAGLQRQLAHHRRAPAQRRRAHPRRLQPRRLLPGVWNPASAT